MITLGFTGLGSKTTGTKCHFHRIRSWVHTINMTPHGSAGVRVPHCTYSPPPATPSPHCLPWREVTMPPTLQEWAVSTHLGSKVYKLIWNSSCMRGLSLLLIYFFNYLFQCLSIEYGLKHIHIIRWAIIQYSFVAHTVPALAIQLFPVAPVSLWHTPVIVSICFLAYPDFLALPDIPGLC